MRKDFGNFVTSSSRIRRYFGLMSLVVLAFLLASISGPSAAIAILPRLEWWPVRPSDSGSLPVIYLNSSMGSTFPTVVTYPQLPCTFEGCEFLGTCATNTTDKYWCLSSGSDMIMNSGMMQSLLAGNLVPSPAQILIPSYDFVFGNITIFSRSLNGNVLRETSKNSTSAVFVASVVPDIVALSLGYFWENQDQTNSLARPMAKTSSGRGQISGLQKPIVQVQCTGSYHIITNSTPDMVSFPMKYHSPADQSWTLPLAEILANSTFNDSYDLAIFDWVELGMPEAVGPSAAAVFLVTPDVYTNIEMFDPSLTHNTFACTLDAMWIPSESWIDPTTDDVIHEAINNPLQERHHFTKNHGKIQLSRSWLDAIDVKADASHSGTVLQTLGSLCMTRLQFYPDHTTMDVCLESVIALFVADGLARMQGTTNRFCFWRGNGELFTVDSHLSGYDSSTLEEVVADHELWLNTTQDAIPRFTLEVMQYGYGYGFQGSKGIYIATVILLIYVLVALIHTAVLIIGGWSSNTWSKPGELIALAVNSSPSKLLQNTCAGIENSKLWNQIVFVRETSEAHLEIVFEEETERNVDEETPYDKQSIKTQEAQLQTDELDLKVRRRVVSGKKYGTIE